MGPIKHILVALDLTETDLTLIQHADFMAKRTGAEKVYFLHVAATLIDPDHKEHDEPVDEEKREQMEAEVRNYFNGGGAEAEFKVVEGSPMEQLLHWAVVKDADLIIAGRKSVAEGSGVVVEKLTRKAPCSVYLVPTGKAPKWQRILASTDFSDFSKDAMELAATLAGPSDEAAITCKHFYHVPIGYYKTGKSYEEFAEIMLGHAQKRFEKFISASDTKGVPVEPVFVLDDDRDVARNLIGQMDEKLFDVAVIGSKGRTAASAMLMGSVAEKVIRFNLNTPLLVVKGKGENMSFLQSLLTF
jgi:nucleotide-binding universal stress UspA family protein